MTTKEISTQLKDLSTEIFKKPNLWRKLLDRGYLEDTKDTVKGKARRTGVEILLPIKRRKHYAPETLLAFLQGLKKQIEEAKKPKAGAINEDTVSSST